MARSRHILRGSDGDDRHVRWSAAVKSSLLTLVVVSAMTCALSGQEKTIVLKSARMFDGHQMRTPGIVVVSSDLIDVGLRNAAAAGIIPGPRMLVSVRAIGSTGGHCDEQNGFRPGLFGRETGPEQGVINSPEEGRRAVRLNVKYGADVIK